MPGSTNASIRRRFQSRNVGDIGALGVLGEPAERIPGFVKAAAVEIPRGAASLAAEKSCSRAISILDLRFIFA
jgi:hypothetical protein